MPGEETHRIAVRLDDLLREREMTRNMTTRHPFPKPVEVGVSWWRQRQWQR